MKTKSAGSNSGASAIRSFHWWVSLAVGVFVLLLVMGAALYVERANVAALLLQRYLNAHGVEAQIEFGRLTWGGFLARVRTGPVEAPDFTAEGVDVTLIYPDTSVVGRITPQVARVRLIRPFLRIAYDGRKFSFGSLQSLVDEAFAGSTNGNQPAVTVESGNLLFATPNGTLSFVGDAAIANGRLVHLKASLQPSTLRGESIVAEIATGTVSADFIGEVLNASVEIKSKAVTFRGRSAREVEMRSNLRSIKWENESAVTKFAVAGADIVLNAAAAETPEAAVAESASRIVLENVAGSFEDGRLQATARGEVTSKLARLRVAGGAVAVLDAQSTFSSLIVEISQAAWSADGAAHVVLRGSGAKYPMLARELSLSSIIAEFDYAGTVKAEGAAGTLRGSLSASGNLPRGFALRTLRADFDGSGAIGKSGSSGTLKASLFADGNVPRAAALDWARQIPGIGGDEATASAIAGALQAATLKISNVTIIHTNEGTRFDTQTPTILDGMGDRSVTLRPQNGRPLAQIRGGNIDGAFGLDMQGSGLPNLRLAVSSYRYRLDGRVTFADADMQVDASVDMGSLRGLHLAAGGKLQVDGNRIAFAAPGCADLAIVSFRSNGMDRIRNVRGRVCGSTLLVANGRSAITVRDCADVSFESLLNKGALLVGDGKGRLCGTMDRTVFVSDASGWRLHGGWTEASARMIAAQTDIANASGHFELSGKGTEIKTGNFAVDQARLSDSLSEPRFLPLSASGGVGAIGTNWQGEFKLISSSHPIASIVVRHSMDTGAGTAAIEARGLAFEPNGLQPANLAPFLGSFGTRVRGHADFTGNVAWSERNFTSDGRLMFSDVEFQSRIGRVREARADLAFSSLVPVALRPNQTVSAGHVETFVPLEQVSARFSYIPAALRLETATAAVAGGRVALDPLTYSFGPGATTTGTLRLENVDFTPLIAAAGLSDRVNVMARIDGNLPFSAGPDGVRFINGHIMSAGSGRLSIKRDALTASVGVGGDVTAPPNAVQDFAYQALENLAFDQLDGTVNSQPMGRLGLLLHIKGRNDPVQVAETRVGVADLLRGRAFDKPLPLPKGTPIDLTLDTSLNLDELLNSYFNGSRTDSAADEASQ
jgi:hypothetical protein